MVEFLSLFFTNLVSNLGASKISFFRRGLNESQRLEMMQNYLKVIILRNPLERLVSAFRDKILAPRRVHELAWRISIVQKYRKKEVDFQTYIRWIVDTPNEYLNEHFAPMTLLSQPCRVRYHYYGNFKRLSSEMKMIADKLGVPHEYFHDHSRMHYTADNKTSSVLRHYYSNVTTKLKKALFRDFYKELDFYYRLFPEEKETLIELLGIPEEGIDF